MQARSDLEQAASLVVKKAEELEIAAEDSTYFTNVCALTQHHGQNLNLVVQFCSPSGSIKLSMRVWEPNSKLIPLMYGTSYKELIDKIFDELKRFALSASLEDLIEVRKILMLEGN